MVKESTEEGYNWLLRIKGSANLLTSAAWRSLIRSEHTSQKCLKSIVLMSVGFG